MVVTEEAAAAIAAVRTKPTAANRAVAACGREVADGDNVDELIDHVDELMAGREGSMIAFVSLLRAQLLHSSTFWSTPLSRRSFDGAHRAGGRCGRKQTKNEYGVVWIRQRHNDKERKHAKAL